MKLPLWIRVVGVFFCFASVFQAPSVSAQDASSCIDFVPDPNSTTGGMRITNRCSRDIMAFWCLPANCGNEPWFYEIWEILSPEKPSFWGGLRSSKDAQSLVKGACYTSQYINVFSASHSFQCYPDQNSDLVAFSDSIRPAEPEAQPAPEPVPATPIPDVLKMDVPKTCIGPGGSGCPAEAQAFRLKSINRCNSWAQTNRTVANSAEIDKLLAGCLENATTQSQQRELLCERVESECEQPPLTKDEKVRLEALCNDSRNWVNGTWVGSGLEPDCNQEIILTSTETLTYSFPCYQSAWDWNKKWDEKILRNGHIVTAILSTGLAGISSALSLTAPWATVIALGAAIWKDEDQAGFNYPTVERGFRYRVILTHNYFWSPKRPHVYRASYSQSSFDHLDNQVFSRSGEFLNCDLSVDITKYVDRKGGIPEGLRGCPVPASAEQWAGQNDKTNTREYRPELCQ